MLTRLAVTYKDLRSIQEFDDKTILAIKAPPDTVLNCDLQEVSLCDCVHKTKFMGIRNEEVEIMWQTIKAIMKTWVCLINGIRYCFLGGTCTCTCWD